MADGVKDIENYLFTELATMLREKYKGITVYPQEVEVPAKFPSVTFVESDNRTYQPTVTADNVEHHATLLYTANVYSDKQGTGKQECKDIMHDIEAFMSGYGFVRTMNEPMQNFERSISRRVARFTGILSDTGIIYKS